MHIVARWSAGWRSVAARRATLCAALLGSAALALSACTSGSGTGNGASTAVVAPSGPASSAGSTTTAPPTAASTAPASGASSSTIPAAAAGAPVHVSLLEGDGGVYGVGMPIIAYVDRPITDASAFAKATTVTVNGKPAAGAWYWEKSGRQGQALEAHYRMSQYWPANAKIYLNLPVKGLSAGRGLTYDDSLTLAIRTGPANVSRVDCVAEKMTVTSNNKIVRTMPVSCGKAKTPTYSGTKVVMQKGEQIPGRTALRPQGTVRMVSNNPADPYDLMVPWSVRLTNSGEYAHAASWNGGNIGIRSTSNGCTNLNVTDAKWFYQFSQLGDVVTYTNTGGSQMPSWDGYGDWNLPWATWQAGGAVTS